MIYLNIPAIRLASKKNFENGLTIDYNKLAIELKKISNDLVAFNYGGEHNFNERLNHFGFDVRKSYRNNNENLRSMKITYICSIFEEIMLKKIKVIYISVVSLEELPLIKSLLSCGINVKGVSYGHPKTAVDFCTDYINLNDFLVPLSDIK